MTGQDTVIINEVGLRDGLQNQSVQVSTDDKLRLAKLLAAAGISHMEATSFVSPQAIPQLSDAPELFRRLPRSAKVRYSALVPNEKGYERALDAGVGRFAVVLSATETMNRKNIRMGLKETRQTCCRILQRADEDGVTGIAYVAVAFQCPYEGRISPKHVQGLVSEMFDGGASEVVIADTIGAASPADVQELFRPLVHAHGAKGLSAHFHDTRALALANAWAALDTGIRKFDASIGGLGGCPFAPGAAGNVATEDLVLMFEQCGYDTGISVKSLLKAVTEAERITGRTLGGRMLTWYRTSAPDSAQDRKARITL